MLLKRYCISILLKTLKSKLYFCIASLVGVKFEILLNKPHWDNAERIRSAFIELARAYKNDSSIGNVFGKPLRGRRVKNDYVIDSSNSMYPYAKQIEIIDEVRYFFIFYCVLCVLEIKRLLYFDKNNIYGIEFRLVLKVLFSSKVLNVTEETKTNTTTVDDDGASDFPFFMALFPAGMVLILAVLIFLACNRKTFEFGLCC